MDRLTKDRRSWNMSRIRGKDTRPERRVRSLLHGMGFRFRLHSKKLPGNPDIVLPKYKTVVLVHGCFWHRHRGCKFAYTPKSRKDFWSEKFRKNVARDAEVANQLVDVGWKVLVVWECQTEAMEQLGKALQRLLSAKCKAVYVEDVAEATESAGTPTGL